MNFHFDEKFRKKLQVTFLFFHMALFLTYVSNSNISPFFGWYIDGKTFNHCQPINRLSLVMFSIFDASWMSTRWGDWWFHFSSIAGTAKHHSILTNVMDRNRLSILRAIEHNSSLMWYGCAPTQRRIQQNLLFDLIFYYLERITDVLSLTINDVSILFKSYKIWVGKVWMVK